MPPTPPPDIDLDLWEDSIDRILDWQPESLGLTHFGEVTDPEGHLDVVRERLREQGELAASLGPRSSSIGSGSTWPSAPIPRPPRRCSRQSRPSSSGQGWIGTDAARERARESR